MPKCDAKLQCVRHCDAVLIAAKLLMITTPIECDSDNLLIHYDRYDRVRIFVVGG